ncbi:MAG: hypothetical protein IPH30_17130 [Betaproteobacteria bacterium]|nr:hypothetical protein [Betaproteobacteria bacterium]
MGEALALPSKSPRAYSNITDRKYWLWPDVRLTNVTSGFDRYTQPGRNFGVNARWRF